MNRTKASRLTINDIARLCSVSKGTVNRAIHNKPGINIETKERILQTIRDCGYEPNYFATSLATGKSNSVGLIVPNISNVYFSDLYTKIEDLCYRKKLIAELSLSNDDSKRESDYIQSYIKRNVSGIILFPVSSDSTELNRAVEAGIPVVCVLNVPQHSKVSVVKIDDYQGVYRMVRELIAAGHRRIAYVDGYCHFDQNYNRQINCDRIAAYRAALEEAGIAVKEEYMLLFDHEAYKTGDTSIVERILALEERPTAVVCHHDRMAIWMYRKLSDCGIRIPDDMVLAGFDDLAETYLTVPGGIPTCHAPITEIAETAVKLLLETMNGTSSVKPRVVELSAVPVNVDKIPRRD